MKIASKLSSYFSSKPAIVAVSLVLVTIISIAHSSLDTRAPIHKDIKTYTEPIEIADIAKNVVSREDVATVEAAPTPTQIAMATVTPVATPTIFTTPTPEASSTPTATTPTLAATSTPKPTTIVTATPTPTKAPVAPYLEITFPTEMQKVESDKSTQCIVDVPVRGTGPGLQRRHNINDAGWTEYVDHFTLCIEPKEGLNRVSVQYKNQFGLESEQITRTFEFTLLK